MISFLSHLVLLFPILFWFFCFFFRVVVVTHFHPCSRQCFFFVTLLLYSYCAPLLSYSYCDPCALFQIFTVLRFLYLSRSIPLIFPLPIFCPPVGLSFLSVPMMNWDIRSWLPAFVTPACWLSFSFLFFSPFFLPTSHAASPFPKPPECIKTLCLFYLYVNAPSHRSPLFSFLCSTIYSQFLSVEGNAGNAHNSVDTEQIMFCDHTKWHSSSSLLIRFQHVVSLITGVAFTDIIVTGILSC